MLKDLLSLTQKVKVALLFCLTWIQRLWITEKLFTSNSFTAFFFFLKHYLLRFRPITRPIKWFQILAWLFTIQRLSKFSSIHHDYSRCFKPSFSQFKEVIHSGFISVPPMASNSPFPKAVHPMSKIILPYIKTKSLFPAILYIGPKLELLSWHFWNSFPLNTHQFSKSFFKRQPELNTILYADRYNRTITSTVNSKIMIIWLFWATS